MTLFNVLCTYFTNKVSNLFVNLLSPLWVIRILNVTFFSVNIKSKSVRFLKNRTTYSFRINSYFDTRVNTNMTFKHVILVRYCYWYAISQKEGDISKTIRDRQKLHLDFLFGRPEYVNCTKQYFTTG